MAASIKPEKHPVSNSIPTRRVVLSDQSQIPTDYSTTPGGTWFSTTPGGTRYIGLNTRKNIERNGSENFHHHPDLKYSSLAELCMTAASWCICATRLCLKLHQRICITSKEFLREGSSLRTPKPPQSRESYSTNLSEKSQKFKMRRNPTTNSKWICRNFPNCSVFFFS